VSPYLILGVPLFAVFWNLYWLVVRPERKRRRKAALAVPAVPAPEPRAPRDASRPYPRPKGHRSKLNRVCPVCGTGRETGNLDRRVLGWPAHRTCAEWLGDWNPVRPIPHVPPEVVAELQQALDAYPAQGGSFGNWPLQLPAGDRTGMTSPEVKTCALLASGHITADEARERLDREITGTFGVPPASLADLFTRWACPDCGMEFTGTPPDLAASRAAHDEFGQCEQRRRKMAKATLVFPEYCTCGKSFTGTARENRRALDAHHASGECPHSAKGR